MIHSLKMLSSDITVSAVTSLALKMPPAAEVLGSPSMLANRGSVPVGVGVKRSIEIGLAFAGYR